MSHRNVTIRELFRTQDQIECDEAIESLKSLCESRYYEGFTACSLAMLSRLEQGISPHGLATQLAHWIVEAQVHAAVRIETMEAEDIARRLAAVLPPDAGTPGRN